MPSPTRPIPVTAVESDWFKPVLGYEGITCLPVSIPPGCSMTAEGSIKVLIRPNEPDPLPGVQFFRREDIVINAEMPWLKRPLPHFEYTKTVDLQYPCELRNFSNLATLAQGTTGKVTCEVREISTHLSEQCAKAFKEVFRVIWSFLKLKTVLFMRETL